MAIPSHAASTTVESPAGMNVFAGQAKPVAPSLGRASQPIRLPADSEPPAAHSCSRTTSATAGRSGRSATRGFPETRRPDSTIPNDVWGRNDHRRPERVAISAVRYLVQITGSPRNRTVSEIFDSASSPLFSGHSRHRRLPPHAPRCRDSPVVREPASGIEFGCFRIAYGAPHCLDERIVGIRTNASRGSRRI